MPVRIGELTIGESAPPYIIAEMSGNHDGSLDRALEIVDMAADAGAHAVKLQTYTADTMTIDLDRDEFVIDDPRSLWYGRSLYGLFEEAHTPWDWHGPIMERAKSRGIACFSSPFDASAVELLEDLDVPAYKIASFESVDLPLIKLVASTGKPMIISTGIATLSEIEEAVAAAREGGCKELILLKCTSSYPASPDDSNLVTIQDLKSRFECEVGLSDHTLGIGVGLAAVALGAVVIEKHVTMSRVNYGVDSAFSLEPHELAALVEESQRAARSLGSVHYGPTNSELGAVKRRRSLYIVEDLPTGGRVSTTNLRSIRPGLGLPPKHYEELLGRRVTRDVARGTPASWELFE